MRKRNIAAIVIAAAALSLSACARDPEESVVRSKDLDQMIETAQDSEEGTDYSGVADEVKENAESYQKEFEDASLNVKVHVDASVTLPETSQLSVFRVSQKKLTQEFLDKAREELSPEVVYYDGNFLNMKDKTALAKEIQEMQRDIDGIKAGTDGLDEESAEVIREERRARLEELQAEYERAPDKLVVTDYPSDHTIHTVKEKYDSDPEDNFLEWEYSLNPNGEYYYGISDGSDGNCRTLFLQNNEDYGNCLRYTSSENGYFGNVSAVMEDDIVDEAAEDQEKPEGTDRVVIYGEMVETELGKTTISREEAQSAADAMMERLGLSEYQVMKGGLYFEEAPGDESAEESDWCYRRVYKFLYMRNIDGVFVDNRAGQKLVDEWRGDANVKKLWSGEAVILTVNDSGVIGFEYDCPLTIDETIVENASIKSFEEIKGIFEQMVLIENAAEEGSVSIDITDVRLIYTRISEKDSFDTGILVPVWSFEGTRVDEYGLTTEGSIMSINAIDGSVIDWELGY